MRELSSYRFEVHVSCCAKKKVPKGRRILKVNAGSGETALPFKRTHRTPSRDQTEIRPPLSTASTYVGSYPESQLPLPSISSPMSGMNASFGNLQGSSPVLPQMPEMSHPAVFRRSPLDSDGLIKACVDAFFVHKYPIMPVLDREETYVLLSFLDESPENCSLVTSLCALIVLQPEIIDPLYLASVTKLPSAEFLISEANRARSFCDYVEQPSLAHAQTSFFFFAALFSLGKDNSA